MSGTGSRRGKPGASRATWWWAGIALLPLALLLRIAAFRAPVLVERAYSGSLYPLVVRALAALTGRLPFSVAEAVLLALTALGLFLLWRAWRRGSWRRLTAPGGIGALVAGGWMLAGAILLVFQLSWGLNYARPSLAVRLDLSDAPPSVEEITGLAMRAASGAAELYQLIGADAAAPTTMGLELPGLDRLLEQAYERLALPGDAVGTGAVPAKGLLASPLLSRLGISGIFIPFTGEPSINTEQPDASLPVVVGHEKAHQRGITDEGEANLAGVMACLVADDPYLRYSAHLEIASRLIGAIAREEPEAAAAAWERLGAGPRADLVAIGEFWESHRGTATRVARSVNDAYLRSNRVPGGIRSYGRVADMLVALDRAGQLEVAPAR